MGRLPQGKEIEMFDGKNHIVGKMFYVICMEDRKEYGFIAATPFEAMRKMIYTLNLANKCEPKIHKTESGLHLWFEHNGKTYAIRNERRKA